jgi:hypothetical protein
VAIKQLTFGLHCAFLSKPKQLSKINEIRTIELLHPDVIIVHFSKQEHVVTPSPGCEEIYN